MNIKDMQNEGLDGLESRERRAFLKCGFTITGVFLGGSLLSLSSVRNISAMALDVVPKVGEVSYSPHYTMVLRERLCIDCERCKDACAKTNKVPKYGHRTTILERSRELGDNEEETIFMPVLCNHCNRPPCVRVCPTTATYKDKKTGIVVMNDKMCIGCKTCMAACPYNARYFHEERRAVDKCNFCLDTRLSKGNKETACVEACPADVRVFGDLADPTSRVFELLHTPETQVWVLRPETGAMPNVFYVNS